MIQTLLADILMISGKSPEHALVLETIVPLVSTNLKGEKRIVISTDIKKEIAEHLGFSGIGKVNKALKACVECGLLGMTASTIYTLNSQIFEQADWSQDIQIVSKYSQEGKTNTIFFGEMEITLPLVAPMVENTQSEEQSKTAELVVEQNNAPSTTQPQEVAVEEPKVESAEPMVENTQSEEQPKTAEPVVEQNLSEPVVEQNLSELVVEQNNAPSTTQPQEVAVENSQPSEPPEPPEPSQPSEPITQQNNTTPKETTIPEEPVVEQAPIQAPEETTSTLQESAQDPCAIIREVFKDDGCNVEDEPALSYSSDIEEAMTKMITEAEEFAEFEKTLDIEKIKKELAEQMDEEENLPFFEGEHPTYQTNEDPDDSDFSEELFASLARGHEEYFEEQRLKMAGKWIEPEDRIEWTCPPDLLALIEEKLKEQRKVATTEEVITEEGVTEEGVTEESVTEEVQVEEPIKYPKIVMNTAVHQPQNKAMGPIPWYLEYEDLEDEVISAEDYQEWIDDEFGHNCLGQPFPEPEKGWVPEDGATHYARLCKMVDEIPEGGEIPEILATPHFRYAKDIMPTYFDRMENGNICEIMTCSQSIVKTIVIRNKDGSILHYLGICDPHRFEGDSVLFRATKRRVVG